MDFSNTPKREKVILSGHFGENNYGDIYETVNWHKTLDIEYRSGPIERNA